ncbi:MAG: PAS domain S-box protein [Desulfarculus sp.]|nr:PAS domain S-box protein [Desulfarculus sp.]
MVNEAAGLAQKLLDLCPIGIIGVDRQGLITIFNPAAERLTGRQAAEALGKDVVSVIYGQAAEARRVKKLLYSEQFGGPGRLEGVEIAGRDAQGQSTPISLWAFILYEDGAEAGSVGFFYDLSNQKRSEEARLMQEKMKSILEMAGAVLHHLSQPLQVMLGDVSLLLDETPQESPVRDSVEALAQGITQVKVVLDKIRKVSTPATAAYGREGKIVDLETPDDPGKGPQG